MESPLEHQTGLTRSLSAALLALFLGWFILPSCHCQWETLFGDSLAPDLPVGCSAQLGTSAPDSPCHCDDCPGKTFENPGQQDLGSSLSQSHFLALTSGSYQKQAGTPGRPLSRGPPEDIEAEASRKRLTFLRHRSLLI